MSECNRECHKHLHHTGCRHMTNCNLAGQLHELVSKRDFEHESSIDPCLVSLQMQLDAANNEIEQLKQNFGLSQLSHKQKVDQLLSCEKALDERDEQIEQLKRGRDELKYIIIAHQVADETGYIDGEGWVEGYSQMTDKVQELLKAHNIEQRAKGIEDALNALSEEYRPHGLKIKYSASDVASHLRTQAKYRSEQLRKQAEEL